MKDLISLTKIIFMYSIDFDNSLIKDVKLVDIDLLNPHEKIIEKNEYIEKIESVGDYVGEYKLQNKIVVTLNNSENIDID